MKRILITIVTLIVAGVGIAMILSNNKKENEAKIALVNENDGYATVKALTVRTSEVSGSYSVNGNFMANRELDFKAENPGVIKSILVKEGDFVKQGQTLAVMDDKFLVISQEMAENAYQKLLVDQKRYQSSFETGGVTQAQLDEINFQVTNAENQLKEIKRRNVDANIKAPFSGFINQKFIEIGDYLNPGQPLFEIVDVSSLKLKVSVDENRISKVKVGDDIAITIPVFPDKTYSGKISFIAAKADETLNFPVEIKLDNDEDNLIKAGMYATATFGSETKQAGLFIPRQAFANGVNSREVFLLNNDNTVSLVKVLPGITMGSQIEVLEGLKEGDQIIVSGQINLIDGSFVKVQD